MRSGTRVTKPEGTRAVVAENFLLKEHLPHHSYRGAALRCTTAWMMASARAFMPLSPG